ncbi:MAG: nucleotidyltransferase family protein [Deltaproteobacteria bacterium]|nr:MAG: nucleotidyltransferase family protein [Deltaproteobacteria bacterium]
MNSVERKILACAAVLDPGPARQQRLSTAMSGDVNVDHLIDLALKEGLAGLLYKNLMKAGVLERLGRQHKERLESLYYTAVQFNAKLIHDLKKLLDQLNEKKIDVVLLQGMALLPQIYEDIGLRPLTDIDLWVLDRDYPELVDVLMSQGYQRDRLYPNTFRKGSTIFDISTHLLWADRIRTRKLLISKGQEHIYSDTQIIQFEGRKARSLNQYDQVLFLSLHVLKHSVSRLIWLVDIESLVGSWDTSDWEALVHRAQEVGQEKIIVYIWFLLRHLFDFHSPLQGRQLLRNGNISLLEKKILSRRMNGEPLTLWAPLILLSSGMGWAHRFAFSWENLFPGPEILKQVFPGSSESKVWRLYVKRVLQLIGMSKMS